MSRALERGGRRAERTALILWSPSSGDSAVAGHHGHGGAMKSSGGRLMLRDRAFSANRAACPVTRSGDTPEPPSLSTWSESRAHYHPFSPLLRGEGQGEGRRHTLRFEQASAPHPDLLPVSTGRRGSGAARERSLHGRRGHSTTTGGGSTSSEQPAALKSNAQISARRAASMHRQRRPSAAAGGRSPARPRARAATWCNRSRARARRSACASGRSP